MSASADWLMAAQPVNVLRDIDAAAGGCRKGTPAFAGEGTQRVVAALIAAGTGEAMGEDAAFKVAAELGVDVPRQRANRPWSRR